MANIIFIPGFGFGPEIWENQIEYFTNSGHQAFAARLPREKTLAAMAKNILKELAEDEIDGDIILVGWSLGGMVAMEMASQSDKISKLALVSTTPKFCQSDDWPHGVPSGMLLGLKRKIVANFNSGMNQFYDLIGSEFSRQDNLAGWEQKHAIEALEILEESDLRPVIGKISCPTLIISSEEDQICMPSASRYLSGQIKNSQYSIFPTSHAPFLTNGERFNTLIADFVASR